MKNTFFYLSTPPLSLSLTFNLLRNPLVGPEVTPAPAPPAPPAPAPAPAPPLLSLRNIGDKWVCRDITTAFLLFFSKETSVSVSAFVFQTPRYHPPPCYQLVKKGSPTNPHLSPVILKDKRVERETISGFFRLLGVCTNEKRLIDLRTCQSSGPRGFRYSLQAPS